MNLGILGNHTAEYRACGDAAFQLATPSSVRPLSRL
jgi:hypothetical protein